MPWGASPSLPWATRGQLHGYCCLGDNGFCLSSNESQMSKVGPRVHPEPPAFVLFRFSQIMEMAVERHF